MFETLYAEASRTGATGLMEAKSCQAMGEMSALHEWPINGSQSFIHSKLHSSLRRRVLSLSKQTYKLTMSTKAKEPSEGDVIIARTLSSYAQLRANLASWGGLSANPAAGKVGQEEEDEDFFTAEPEMYDYTRVMRQAG